MSLLKTVTAKKAPGADDSAPRAVPPKTGIGMVNIDAGIREVQEREAAAALAQDLEGALYSGVHLDSVRLSPAVLAQTAPASAGAAAMDAAEPSGAGRITLHLQPRLRLLDLSTTGLDVRSAVQVIGLETRVSLRW